MKEKFILFLKKHRALRKFKTNLKVRVGKTADFDEYTKPEEFGDIDGAFAWSDTLEGHDYWSRLSRLWYDEKNRV